MNEKTIDELQPELAEAKVVEADAKVVEADAKIKAEIKHIENGTHSKTDESTDYFQVLKSEASFFKCPEVTEVKFDEPSIFETNVNIINLSFKEDNKWYVNDGQSSFYVIVEDFNFIKKINENIERFGKGDILRVRLRREQFYTEETKRLKTEHYIEKVIRHTNPPRQILLNIEN